MAREDGVQLSWSMLVTFPLAAVIAAWALSFAWEHRQVYGVARNYELWRIPTLLNDIAAAEAQNPNARPYPEVPSWNGPVRVPRSR